MLFCILYFMGVKLVAHVPDASLAGHVHPSSTKGESITWRQRDGGEFDTRTLFEQSVNICQD